MTKPVFIILLLLTTFPQRNTKWMDAPEITVFRLGGYSRPRLPDSSSFHGFEVKESHVLTEPRRTRLVKFLQTVVRREDREAAAAAKTGALGGGPKGCVTGDRGIRFAGPDGTFDFIVECDNYIRYANERQDLLVVFTEEEEKAYAAIVEPVFERGP